MARVPLLLLLATLALVAALVTAQASRVREWLHWAASASPFGGVCLGTAWLTRAARSGRRRRPY
jgi:hypothetical protein